MLNLKRLLTITRKEASEIYRDKIRFWSNFIIPIFLLILFGAGMTLDIDNIPFATLDFDNTQESRKYLDAFINSNVYDYVGKVYSDKQANEIIDKGKARFVIEIKNGYGRDLQSKKQTQIGFFIDGTMPFRAETIRGYALGTHYQFMSNYSKELTGDEINFDLINLKSRFWYNQAVESKYTFVPALIGVVLMAMSAIMMALSVVREKESGTITNFYSTPLSKLEFLLGKQFIYVIISFINYFLLMGVALFFFRVPIKGSFLLLTTFTFLFSWASTGIGLLVSTFVKTQVSAVLITMILTMVPSFMYAGLLTPISSLGTGAQITARLYPIMYFTKVSVGTFTKNLPMHNIINNFFAVFIITSVLITVSVLLLKKQAK